MEEGANVAGKDFSRNIGFDGKHGEKNSIVDVHGVEVGHETIIRDFEEKNGKTTAVRTGVSAILPQGRKNLGKDYFCGVSTFNGNGEVTGMSWIDESGMLSGPIMLTNTYSVGEVRDAVLKWLVANNIKHDALPVVCEISDEFLNNISGHHVTDEHVFSAINGASPDNTEQGNVGGGTGAVCYEFKGGIGTSSRLVNLCNEEYTVGVLVQANHGLRRQLMVKGVPIGKNMREHLVKTRETGSIVIVVATDAPLLPHQLKRLSRRAYLGMARTGNVSSDGSGDFSLAFSVANSYVNRSPEKATATWLPNAELDPLFEGVVQSTEEAIVNALFYADSMRGINGHYVSAIPVDELAKLLNKNDLER